MRALRGITVDALPGRSAPATEGARAALDYAFTLLEKDRVISLIHPDNAASIRVAERIGERLQGRIHHFGREVLCYGIDREIYLQEALPLAMRRSELAQGATA